MKSSKDGIPDFRVANLYLWGAFLSIITIILIGAFSIWATNVQSQLVEKIYQHPFTVSTNVLEADANLVAMHRYMKDVVIARSPSALHTAVDLVSHHEDKVLKHLETAKKDFLGSKQRFQNVIDAVVDWRVIRAEVIELSTAKQYDAAAEITINKGAEYVKFLNQEMSGLVEFARAKAANFLNESRSQKAQFQTLKITVYSTVTIALSILFALMYRLIGRSEEAIRDSEFRYRSIYNTVPLSIWDEDFSAVYLELEKLRGAGVIDLKQYFSENPEIKFKLVEQVRVIHVNSPSLSIFGASTDEELISSISRTFGEGAIDVFEQSVYALWNKDILFEAKANYIGLDGRKIIGHISVPIPQSLKESYLVPVVIEDITQKEALDAQQKLMASVFTEADEGICIVSPDVEIIEINQAFTSITGYEREEVIGENPRILKSDRHDNSFYKGMWEGLLNNDVWRGEVWDSKKDGTVYPVILTVSVIRDDLGRISNYVGLFTDITQQKQHESDLQRLAHFDPLTGLANRALFSDRLKHAIAVSERDQSTIAVAFLDLDDFKDINDLYGHNIGDELLIEVAKRITESIRSVDSLSRVGGDEFIAIFHDLGDREHLCHILDRILSDLSKPFYIRDLQLSVTVSIGVTTYADGEHIEGDQLQRQADQAMYEAKLAGRNRYRFYDPENNTVIANRFKLISEIEKAISEDEFELYFQPKLNLESGEVIGAEALIRWNHPERGLLPPVDFLPHIEKDLISVSLGEWVIKNALKQIKAFVAKGITFPISVNIGPIQLQQENFVERLKLILKQYPQVPPQLLELEILETSSLEDFEMVSRVIKEGNELGIEFAMDDFGSGYSSLVYLKKIPAKILKIDQEFVRTMLQNHDDQVILKGILQLAKGFNLLAIAEGVETYNHVEVLLELGCEQGQGYAISKPLPASDFESWISSWDTTPNWYKN